MQNRSYLIFHPTWNKMTISTQVTNCWLVLYTWLQHTDVDIPHYDKAGSAGRYRPAWLSRIRHEYKDSQVLPHFHGMFWSPSYIYMWLCDMCVYDNDFNVIPQPFLDHLRLFHSYLHRGTLLCVISSSVAGKSPKKTHPKGGFSSQVLVWWHKGG